MKTKQYLVLLISILTSCSTETYEFKEQTGNTTTNNIQVNFLGKINTRVTNNQWDIDDEIGIFMYKHGEQLSESSVINNTSNRKYIYSESQGFAASSTYDIMYYPTSGSVNFAAYHPFGAIENYGVHLNTNNQRNQSNLDFLYSGNLTDIAATEETQKLIFEHQMSKLIFTINAGNGITLKNLTGLSFSIIGVSTSAIFSLSEGEVILNDINTAQNVAALVSTQSTSIQAEAIMIPQSCNGKQVCITLLSGKKYTFNFSNGHQWLGGNKYRYEITLTDDTQEATLTAIIEDWIDNEASSSLEAGKNDFEIIPWNGTSDTSWYSNDKETMDIRSAEALAGLAKLVNNGNSFEGKTINLINDIDMNNLEWIPIGNDLEQTFKGKFNGANHAIRNLNPILNTITHTGLFGINNGSIENLIVSGKYSIQTETGKIIYIGGICGQNNGIINNCRNCSSITGEVEYVTKEQSNPYIGGIAGINMGTISYSQNYGNLSGKNINIDKNAYIHIGGIAGANTHIISFCENTQNIIAQNGNVRAGGITGLSSGKETKVIDCTNIGSITITAAHVEASAGGIIGQSKKGASVSGSINKGNVQSLLTTGTKVFGGGIVAYNDSSFIYRCSNKGEIISIGSEDADNAAASGGIAGYNINKATIHTSQNYGIISASGSQFNFIGGIAGFNKIDNGSTAYTYCCCTNEGYPTQWIGNATSTNDMITTTEHSEE